MGNIQEYKCPCCGGAIVFDSAIQKMKCPCCDTEFEMEALQGYDDALKQQEQGDDMTWDTAREASGRKVKRDCVHISVNPVVVRSWETKVWRPLPAHTVAIRLF